MIVVKVAVIVDIGSVLMNVEIGIMKKNVKGNVRNILEMVMIAMIEIETVTVIVKGIEIGSTESLETEIMDVIMIVKAIIKDTVMSENMSVIAKGLVIVIDILVEVIEDMTVIEMMTVIVVIDIHLGPIDPVPLVLLKFLSIVSFV